MKSNKKMARLALLTVLGLAVFVMESFLPRPLPWAKPGLANVATLIALYFFELRSAMMVVVVRVIIAALILGTFANPAFLLTLCAGTTAAAMMGLAYTHFRGIFSLVGISIIGAVTHNLVQLVCAYFLLVRNIQIFYLLPWMILPALATGLIVGFVTLFFIHAVEKAEKGPCGV